MSSIQIPLAAVVLVPAVGAIVSGVVRLTMVVNSNDRPGIWNIFAVGPDLMIAAVVAIPALLAGRNAEIAEIKNADAVTVNPKALNVLNANWSISGYMVIIIFCLALIGLSCERLWCKPAREKNGFKEPFLKGVLLPTVCGLAALGAALVLGTP
jgi:hypothetical protein